MIAWRTFFANRSKAVNELVLSRRENRALADMAAEPKPASEIDPDILETLTSHGLIVETLGHWRTTARGQLELHRQRFRKRPGRRVAHITPSRFLFLQETAFAGSAPTRAKLREFVRRKRELDSIPFINSIWPRPTPDDQFSKETDGTDEPNATDDMLAIDDNDTTELERITEDDDAAVSDHPAADSTTIDTATLDGTLEDQTDTGGMAQSKDEGIDGDDTAEQSGTDAKPKSSKPEIEASETASALEPDAIDEVLEQFGIALPETDEIETLTEREAEPADDEPPILELSEGDIVKSDDDDSDSSSSSDAMDKAEQDLPGHMDDEDMADKASEDAKQPPDEDSDSRKHSAPATDPKTTELPSSSDADDTVVQLSRPVGRRRSKKRKISPRRRKQDASSEG